MTTEAMKISTQFMHGKAFVTIKAGAAEATVMTDNGTAAELHAEARDLEHKAALLRMRAAFYRQAADQLAADQLQKAA